MVATTPDNAKVVTDVDEKMDEEENTEPPRLTVDDQIDGDDDDVEPANLSVLQAIRSMPVVAQEAAYGAEKTGSELAAYIEEVSDTVRIGFDQSIAILSPWFFNNMPDVYYQTTPKAEKIKHLSAIITGHVFETKQTVELWNRHRNKVTYIGPGNDQQITLNTAQRLASVDLDIKMGFLYFSRDYLLFLSSFFCQGLKPLDLDNQRIAEKSAKRARCSKKNSLTRSIVLNTF